MKISKNLKIVYGIAAMLFIVMFLLYQVSMSIWGAYTVGKITRINTVTGGTKVSYQFNVKGKQYTSMITEPIRDENVGRPYLIHYLKFMPSVSLLLPDHPADSCFKELRNKTFDTIPICDRVNDHRN